MKTVLGLLALATISAWQPTLAAPWNAPQFPAPSHAHSRSLRGHHATGVAPPYTNYTQSIHWFQSQTLDHFNLTDQRTWSQRYFVIDTFWSRKPDAPVIFHICGEYTCPGIMPARLFPLKVAAEQGALVVSLEHRFFGESAPLSPATTAALAYHNSRQALNDMVTFQAYFRTTYMAPVIGQTAAEASKWVGVGGSYPGALSAWLRIKYPHAVVGSHSSSGVVNAILQYTQFDWQVGQSADMYKQGCADTLRTITAAAEAAMPGIKAKFGAENLLDGDFFYLLADAAAEAIQYGHVHVVCDAIMGQTDPLTAFINYTQTFFYKQMGNSAADYDSTTLADPVNGGNGRSWWWQKCTELAYWQIAPPAGAIRSSQVNMTYHEDLCKRVFGLTSLPDVDATNEYYGGAQPGGTNVYFANGIQDPWQWAGVRASLRPSMPADVIDCIDCAHCADLYTPTPEDAPALQADRAAVEAAIDAWLKQ